MTPQTFKQTIHTIWGANAQTILAHRMGFNDARTVRRWIAGHTRLPDRAIEAVKAGLADKQKELNDLKKMF